MGSESRADPSDLIEALLRSGHRFDFFQAVLLLETSGALGAPVGEAEPLGRERVRFRSDPSLGFPATDIASIERDERDPDRLSFRLHFMGLTGTSSPLPTYFLEPVAKQLDGGAVLADLLAIFEHRTYSFFWRAWKKYRLDLAPADSRRAGTRFLQCLAGLGVPELEERKYLEAIRLIPFAGLLGTRHRTAAGLRNVVSGYFGGLRVRVQPCVARRVWVRDRAPLGTSGPSRLGGTALVGDTVRDSSALVRVRIGPLDLATYVGLLPGGERGFELGELVSLYLPTGLDFQIEMALRREEVPPLRLGHEHARLGRLTWVGRPAGDGESGPIPRAAFAAA